MTDYYVSPSGSNSNSGLSAAAPWLTLSYANSNTTSGDRIFHLSGGTWADQSYNFTHSITLDVYNGSVRWIMNYDGSDGGTYFALITTSAANTSINSVELRNNLSGSDSVDGGRGIAFSGSNTTIDDVYITNVGSNGITRDGGGDTVSVTNSVLENIASLYTSGIYSGGIAAIGDSNPVDSYTVSGCQLLEVHGEAISAFTFNASNRCTDVTVEDNDVCGGQAAGVYFNGVNGGVARRNVITGTTNASYHRGGGGGYSGYGLGQDNESASSTTNNNTRFYLNLVAFCEPGFYVSDGVGTAITNMNVAHNTFVDNLYTVSCIAGSSFSGAGNIFRQNASILLTGGMAHDDGTNVPGGADWDKDENFWEGGGEHANLNDATDLSDTAWLPFRTTGWQTIDAISDVTVEDWRPTTQTLGTQFTNPDTAANWADYEGTADFREAGALAYEAVDAPGAPEDPPLNPPTPGTVLGRLFKPPRVYPIGASVVPGGLLYFYRTGTATYQAVYHDKNMRIPHTNPVVASSTGEFPKIFLNPDSGYDYRVQLTTSTGSQIWLEDDVDTMPTDRALVTEGTFTAILTGLATDTTPTIYYKVVKDDDGTGKVATLRSSGSTGTSDATSMTLTHLPSILQPASTALCPCLVTDNGGNYFGAASVSSSVITFQIDEPLSATGFTNTGTKGLPVGWSITYQL